MTSPTSLTTFRRARELREQRKGLALAVTAEPGVVTMIVGNEQEGARVAETPDVLEMVALEILDACRAAREAK